MSSSRLSEFSPSRFLTLEFTALERVGVKIYSVLLSLDPAIAAVALLILGQYLSLPEFGGIGLVVAASAGAIATGRVS